MTLVLVTGAGGGIGRATALHFAQAGARVIVTDIDEDTAHGTAALCEEHGASAYAYPLDVADAGSWERLAEQVRRKHGVPDVVVNNAGIWMTGSFLDHSTEDWERLIGVNVMGVVHGCRLFGAQMVERGEGGHIVNLASAGAFLPNRLAPGYCVTKAAVRMLSECLRIELAADGIGVTAICPGATRTNLVRNGEHLGVDAETAARWTELAASAQQRFSISGPEKVARVIARSVRFDWAIVPVGPEAWLGYALHRASPGFLRAFTRIGSPELAAQAVERVLPRFVRDAVS